MMLERVVTAVAAGLVVSAVLAALGHAAPTTLAAPKPTATKPAMKATPTAAATGAAARSSPIAVMAREFLYEPKQFTVKAGDVTFVVKNTGAIDHDFAVDDAKNKTLAQAKPFPAGKTVEVKVTLSPGNYTIFCSIPGHREAGMTAVLKAVP